jgi:hypothetical protein
MEEQSLLRGRQHRVVSKGLQNVIDSMVEEIVLEGKPFDTQKKYLKKYSDNEGLNYDELEKDLIAFIELLDNLKSSFSEDSVRVAQEKAKACYISESKIPKLISFCADNKDVAKSGTRLAVMAERTKKRLSVPPNLNNKKNGFAPFPFCSLIVLFLLTVFFFIRLLIEFREWAISMMLVLSAIGAFVAVIGVFLIICKWRVGYWMFVVGELFCVLLFVAYTTNAHAIWGRLMEYFIPELLLLYIIAYGVLQIKNKNGVSAWRLLRSGFPWLNKQVDAGV